MYVDMRCSGITLSVNIHIRHRIIIRQSNDLDLSPESKEQWFRYREPVVKPLVNYSLESQNKDILH